MISLSGLKALVQSIQFTDPRLYDLLIGIISRLQVNETDINEIKKDLSVTAPSVSLSVPPVEVFTYTIYPDYVLLSWERPAKTSSTEYVANFELRKGSSWDTAQRILVTNTTTAIIQPLSTGTHTYLIKSIGDSGAYSVAAKSLDIIVPAIGATQITHDVIDNYVLLYWTAPTSPFRISYYIVKRGTETVGYKDGTFTSIFEQVAGLYTYSITPVDVAGNVGPTVERQVQVNAPPDYILQDIRVSTLNGFKGSCALVGSKLLFGIENQTWEQHFLSRGWNTIQDQINAGYPIYAQPSPAQSFYEESGIYTIDYGTVLNSLIVNIDWTYETIAGSGHNITAQSRVSTDNTSWSSWVVGKSVYYSSFRYLQIHIDAVALS